MANQRIEIRLSKPKIARLLVFSIAFLAIGIWMMTSERDAYDQLIKTIVAAGGIIMGTLGMYFFGRKLLDNKPGLVIDELGIIDNTSAFRFGLIPWTDMAGIYGRTVRASVFSKQHFVTIKLKDPVKYITREKSVLKRKMMQANSNQYDSPVHISTNGLKMEHKELLEVLTAAFEKYRQQP